MEEKLRFARSKTGETGDCRPGFRRRRRLSSKQFDFEIALISVAPSLRWQLPKGLVDAGETAEIAALREVREEAGIDCDLVEKLETIEYWYVGDCRGERVRFHKFVHFFLMKYVSGDVADHDHEVAEARWVKIDEAIGDAGFQGRERGCRKSVEIYVNGTLKSKFSMRDIPVGNGSLLVNFDDKYQIRDIYFPHVGQENHTEGFPFRFGVWADGEFSWISSDDWQRSLNICPKRSLRMFSLINEKLGVEIVSQRYGGEPRKHFSAARRASAICATRNEKSAFFCITIFAFWKTNIGDTAFYDPESSGAHSLQKRSLFSDQYRAAF